MVHAGPVRLQDEPTSGLDARAAAIVMRTVRNTVNTGRTVVCTIHQPSIDIFEARPCSVRGSALGLKSEMQCLPDHVSPAVPSDHADGIPGGILPTFCALLGLRCLLLR